MAGQVRITIWAFDLLVLKVFTNCSNSKKLTRNMECIIHDDAYKNSDAVTALQKNSAVQQFEENSHSKET